MNDIEIYRNGDDLRTDSRQLAPYLNHRHRTILENIDRYLPQLKQLGAIPFQSEKGQPLPQGGFSKSIRYALLNEDQCYFLLTLMRNNPTVIEAKLKLVQAFRQARSELARAQIERLEGKKTRRMETDAIKDLVNYATADGSQSAGKYYMTITKMTCSALGIDTGQRDQLSADKLKQIKIAEGIVDIAIREGIYANLHYKEIYQLAKERVKHIVPLVSAVNPQKVLSK